MLSSKMVEYQSSGEASSAPYDIFQVIWRHKTRSILLGTKQQEQRSKFMMDQKNREALLKKRQLEDEERREAAKSRKVLADSSLKLAAFLHKMSDNNNSSELLLAAVNEKIKGVEEKVTKAIDDELGSFLLQMCEMLNHNHQ
jgi:hypothetical protein